MKNLERMTDEQLAMVYSEGNNAAFDLLLERNQNKLYTYIMFVVRDKHIADDVFQDTFVKAIVKLREGYYTTSGKFSAWLMRIAHNVIIDIYRDQKRTNVVEATPDNDLANIESDYLTVSNIERKFIEDQQLKEAKILMEALPATQREIVYMRIYQQMSFKEIAELTGMSINTALGRMRYAILNMRRMAQRHGLAI